MSAITSRLRPITAVKAARPWLTVKEAAEYLGVGIDTIYAACAKRGLKHVKMGHSTIRLKVEWIDAWVEGQTKQTS